jgi:hypothetical protein
MRHAIEHLQNHKFMGRYLRIKKAVEPKRLEKKKRRTEERIKQRQEDKHEANEIDKLRNFEQAAYGEIAETKEEAPVAVVPGISQKSKKIKKDKESSLLDHFTKISKKSEMKSADDYGEIDITNKLGFNKANMNRINKEKLQKGFSKLENMKNKSAFKDQAKFSDSLKQKIEKTRNLNMKKINKIVVKRRVD